MKKLMVLSLVLAMVAVSNGALYIVSDYAGEVLNPGDIVTFGIALDAPYGPFGGDVFIAITNAGVMNPGTAVGISDLSVNIAGEVNDFPGVLNPDGTVGYFMNTLYTNFMTPLAADTVILEGFQVVVSQSGVIQLYNNVVEDAELGDSARGSLAVNVIPEPMTMGLLGLGALFLRRRK